jgi:large subunit ribosomal protein L25
MAETVLNVSLRERLGKGGARSLRRDSQIPAVVYGAELETCSLIVDPKELRQALATESGLNTLMTLKGEGPFDGKVVILKDMQEHPIRRDLVHVDFQAINLKEKILVLVPIQTIGKSEGEKEGGQLQMVRHELEVYCLPTAIPQSIEVDVTAMNIGDVLHVEDIPVPEGVEIPHDVNFTVLTVVGIQAEEEEEVEEGEEGVAAAVEDEEESEESTEE